MALKVEPGIPMPLGAHQRGDGFNFAVFSRHAISVSLVLFERPNDKAPVETILLDPLRNRHGDSWHVWVAGIDWNTLYAWQVDGPYTPQQGHRYNRHKILLDPYTTALAGTDCWDFACACGYDHASSEHDLSYSTKSDAGAKAKCLVVNDSFDWQDDQPPRHAWSDTVIYETHVRGFTIHPSSGVQHPGTYLGVMEKIPYLQELGITAIELLPVQEFYENELVRDNPMTGERLRNYWGYSTVAFFAPKESYATRNHIDAQISEFKTMVRELHRSGIEVILDIVFNHTAEGNHSGPTLNFRGLDNRIYYLLEDDLRYYKNYSGTGNTLNCNHPVVRDYILDCLRHWVIEMHVDGFRFDLASVLGRDENGSLLPNPPLLERIAEDPILGNVKLIAEAWDAGGAWQVGHFAGHRWAEWNCHFRDHVRRFWRGDAGLRGELASRLCGSADLYQASGKLPLNSINFITCHDGFTLNDLVSFEHKHNEANGEDNRDGNDSNWSANYGIEGDSDDPQIETLRLRQLKNLIATLMLSRGVPMLLGGDEFRRTQSGNNNAYCQDNELSWYDWRMAERNNELLRFTRVLIALRKRHPVLCTERFYTMEEIIWFDPAGSYPDWHNGARTLGCLIKGEGNGDAELCLLFNAESETVTFYLPAMMSDRHWQTIINTGESAPDDIRLPKDYKVLGDQVALSLVDHSLAVLAR